MNEFENIEDAARAALLAVKDSDVEHVGIIYQDPETGKFRFTEPLTQNSRKKTGGKHAVPTGSARAIYHNHPMLEKDDELQNKFSEGDIELAKRTGLKSFISANDSVFVWDPENPGEVIPKGGRGSALKESVGIGTLVNYELSEKVAAIKPGRNSK
jgi:hypothetical protein